MLHIRPAQMQVFQTEAEREFARRVAAHLRRFHDQVTGAYDDGQLQTMAYAGVRRARAAGMTQENSIALFVALMFEIAPNFDQQPDIAAYLRARDPDEAIMQLTNDMPEAVWQDAWRKSDPAAWSMPAAASSERVEPVQ